MDPRNAPTVPDAGDGDFEAPPSLGRFAIGRSLGAGGMGVVFEARDTVLDRAVALKLVRPGTSPDPAQGLLREAVALAQLVHPNVVTVFDVGPIGDDVFIAMELVDGDTLRAWMTGAHPWRAIVDMFMAAGRGLAAVHALGRVHRDFKPSNVLIDRAGTPKVGDFGLVCVDGEDAHGVVMGTPGYMAPEQARGGRIDARADQYAFAVALLEALGDAGPARLRPILARARADDPAARFPSMNALLAALARARRGPLRWWLAGLGTAAGLAIIAVAWQVGHVQAAVDPCPAPEAELGPGGTRGAPRSASTLARSIRRRARPASTWSPAPSMGSRRAGATSGWARAARPGSPVGSPTRCSIAGSRASIARWPSSARPSTRSGAPPARSGSMPRCTRWSRCPRSTRAPTPPS
jgi:serine/threonine protein kinase